MGEVHEVNFRTRLVQRRQRYLADTLLRHLTAQGNDIAGFAVVTWNNRGEPMTSFMAAGPIGRGMIPEYVRGSLSQHVAVAITEEGTRVVIDPDHPA